MGPILRVHVENSVFTVVKSCLDKVSNTPFAKAVSDGVNHPDLVIDGDDVYLNVTLGGWLIFSAKFLNSGRELFGGDPIANTTDGETDNYVDLEYLNNKLLNTPLLTPSIMNQISTDVSIQRAVQKGLNSMGDQDDDSSIDSISLKNAIETYSQT